MNYWRHRGGSFLPNIGSHVTLWAAICAIVPLLGAQSPCLDDLPGDGATRVFDASFDRNSQGRSFSCDIYVTASQAQQALEDFRFGFVYDSQAHIERSVSFPLRVSIRAGGSEPKAMLLNDFSEWLEFKSGHFDKYERALIACSTLKNVRIYKRDGGFSIGLGRIWFVPSKDELKVSVITVAPLPRDTLHWLCLGEEPAVDQGPPMNP